MFRRPTLRAVIGAAVAVLVATIGAAGPASSAPALPSPLAFVSQLDLECFKTDPYQPPGFALKISHLNPVLANLPADKVKIGNREQLCVPVAKNGKIPPRDVLPFVQFVDLSCYRVQGLDVKFNLALSHLNPVLKGVRGNEVSGGVLEQLCLPVAKNGKIPPPEVLRLVQYIDLACYAVKPPTPLGIPLTLSQLNPVLAQLPKAEVKVVDNRQLCVPVRKNDQQIPDDVLKVVQWIDLEKYDISAPSLPSTVGLTLNHLNPLLADFPREGVKFQTPTQLGLPVAKNGKIPPG